MQTTQTTGSTQTPNRTAKKVATVVGAAAILIALAALLGEWGWGESSQAQPVPGAAPAAVVAGPIVAGPAGATVTVDGPTAVEASAAADGEQDPAPAPSVDLPSVAAPIPSPVAAPSAQTPPPVVAPSTDPIEVPAPVTATDPSTDTSTDDCSDDGADEDRIHGVDDHAVEHSDQHDESEAVAHGHDEEAHARHAD